VFCCWYALKPGLSSDGRHLRVQPRGQPLHPLPGRGFPDPPSVAIRSSCFPFRHMPGGCFLLAVCGFAEESPYRQFGNIKLPGFYLRWHFADFFLKEPKINPTKTLDSWVPRFSIRRQSVTPFFFCLVTHVLLFLGWAIPRLRPNRCSRCAVCRCWAQGLSCRQCHFYTPRVEKRAGGGGVRPRSKRQSKGNCTTNSTGNSTQALIL